MACFLSYTLTFFVKFLQSGRLLSSILRAPPSSSLVISWLHELIAVKGAADFSFRTSRLVTRYVWVWTRRLGWDWCVWRVLSVMVTKCFLMIQLCGSTSLLKLLVWCGSSSCIYSNRPSNVARLKPNSVGLAAASGGWTASKLTFWGPSRCPDDEKMVVEAFFYWPLYHGPHFSKIFLFFFYVLFVFVSFCVLFVCKCVLYYCHRVATQLQLTNTSSVRSYATLLQAVLCMRIIVLWTWMSPFSGQKTQ